MARTPMVTRTITTTKATVMCCDIEAGDTITEQITVPRSYKNNEALMKVVKPLLETEQIKPVAILQSEVVETLYGMTEQQFIENASVLPPRETATETK